MYEIWFHTLWFIYVYLPLQHAVIAHVRELHP